MHLRWFTVLTYLVNMDAFNMAVLEGHRWRERHQFQAFDNLKFCRRENQIPTA
jgi:hypothetical protein